jgi:hypothetical protein
MSIIPTLPGNGRIDIRDRDLTEQTVLTAPAQKILQAVGLLFDRSLCEALIAHMIRELLNEGGVGRRWIGRGLQPAQKTDPVDRIGEQNVPSKVSSAAIKRRPLTAPPAFRRRLNHRNIERASRL